MLLKLCPNQLFFDYIFTKICRNNAKVKIIAGDHSVMITKVVSRIFSNVSQIDRIFTKLIQSNSAKNLGSIGELKNRPFSKLALILIANFQLAPDAPGASSNFNLNSHCRTIGDLPKLPCRNPTLTPLDRRSQGAARKLV